MELFHAPAASLAMVPQPPPPGLYVTLGPDGLITWALESISKTLAFPARVVWVDAANAFNAYLVAIAARAAGKDSAAVLRSYQVARPFTAYQLETMVSEKTLPAVRRFGALVSVIADPLRLFSDAQGRDTQIRQCFGRFIAGLRAAASETAILVLAPAHHSPMAGYEAALLSAASRITQLKLVNQKPSLSLV